MGAPFNPYGHAVSCWWLVTFGCKKKKVGSVEYMGFDASREYNTPASSINWYLVIYVFGRCP